MCIAEKFQKRSFSPFTLGASTLFMYCKEIKKPCKVSTVSDIFQVTTMSVYRCVKYLKKSEFNNILRQYETQKMNKHDSK